MNSLNMIETEEIERQRERIRALCREKRFEDAATLCAMLSDEVLIFTPCETIADYLSATKPAEAARLYRIEADFYCYEGTQATGLGEGIAAMDNLRRVEDKLKKLQ